MKKISGWNTFTKVMFCFMILIGVLELAAFIVLHIVFWDTSSLAEKIGLPVLSMVYLCFPALGAWFVYSTATEK